eukprot:7940363-Pyramimonas_sp.AAC.1
MFGRRSGESGHDYNPLGESLIIEGVDQDDGVPVQGATGFGNTRRPQSASITERFSRFGDSVRNFLSPPAPSAGSGGGSWGEGGQGVPPRLNAQPPAQPRQTQTRGAPNPYADDVHTVQHLIAACRSVVNAARVSSELLRDTTREVRENPEEATDLGETLSQLSQTCMDQQNQLSVMLTSEQVLADEALLMQALEVNESLALALEGYMMLSTGDALPRMVEEPTVEEQTAAATVQQESEEAMIARAMAESLRTEEERKAKADHENTTLLLDAVTGLTPPPPPPPHAPPPPPPPPPMD